ncbi:hypothetical protein AB834_01450 [PVC group bacterium (ex Bugula neritina AB1)]|nr:hypothetical protein AB834_01450 [PVC group bacterium (ex Bugula neritina AB1)]
MRTTSKTKLLYNWGGSSALESHVITPPFQNSLSKILDTEVSLTIRGQGLNYGDAALYHKTLSTHFWDKIIHFDKDLGLIKCPSGITLDKILRFIVPKGYFLPVTPGSKNISLGGAIAADVHGKNHHHDGSLSSFITSLTIQTSAKVKTSARLLENSFLTNKVFFRTMSIKNREIF